MKRALAWAATNAVRLGLIVAGAVYAVAPAWNLARFLIVLWAIVITAAVVDPKTQKEISQRGRSVPRWVSVTCDVASIVILAGTGHFVFAAVETWQALAEAALYRKAEA